VISHNWDLLNVVFQFPIFKINGLTQRPRVVKCIFKEKKNVYLQMFAVNYLFCLMKICSLTGDKPHDKILCRSS